MRGLMARTAAVAWALILASCQAAPPSSNPATLTTGTNPDEKAAALSKAGVALSPAESTGLRAAPVDSTKHFEYRDVYVNMGDPDGQRQLAYYFTPKQINPWMIDKFENLSDTLRHFRFRRLAGPDGKSLPDVDPLAPK